MWIRTFPSDWWSCMKVIGTSFSIVYFELMMNVAILVVNELDFNGLNKEIKDFI